MAMANMNLIGVFVTKLWPVQALACGGGGGGDGGGDGGDGGGGGGTKTIISPKFSNFGDIIMQFLTISQIQSWGGCKNGGGGLNLKIYKIPNFVFKLVLLMQTHSFFQLWSTFYVNWGQIMTRYDFFGARQVILNNVLTKFNLDLS